jgi:fumarate reductase subunit D
MRTGGRLLDRIRRADEGLRSGLRRAGAITVVVYAGITLLLFQVFLFASLAPHPVSLFAEDIASFASRAFRFLTVTVIVILFIVLGLRIYASLALRRRSR